MGYILPISFDQYTQYVNRTMKEEQKPFSLTPVYKPTIHTKLRNNRQHLEMYKPISPPESRRRVAKDGRFEEILSELTGKGKHVNEYV